MEHIRTFQDGTVMEQGPGKFDDYCVYLTRNGANRYAPTDKEYFSFFIEKSKKYGSETIYNDYVSIYNRTTAVKDEGVLNDIEKISKTYIDDEVDFTIWFSVIYMGMVAEENRKNAILKKRIKRLGMYQIMFEKMSAGDAAFFSVGKKVPALDPLCRERGF